MVAHNIMMMAIERSILRHPKYAYDQRTFNSRLTPNTTKRRFRVVELGSRSVCARAIAIMIYKIDHTIGKTKFGGVMDGFMQSYQVDFVELITFDGKRAVIVTTRVANKYASHGFIVSYIRW